MGENTAQKRRKFPIASSSPAPRGRVVHQIRRRRRSAAVGRKSLGGNDPSEGQDGSSLLQGIKVLGAVGQACRWITCRIPDGAESCLNRANSASQKTHRCGRGSFRMVPLAQSTCAMLASKNCNKVSDANLPCSAQNQGVNVRIGSTHGLSHRWLNEKHGSHAPYRHWAH